MKQTLIYIAAIVLLSVSSFSFAKPTDDKVNELAFVVTCVGVYDALGLNTKYKEQAHRGAGLVSGMGEAQKEEVIARAKLMHIAYRNSGAGLAEIKYLCDDAFYGEE